MELVALPGWAIAVIAVISVMLVVGALEALATRLSNDRDRHDLIVQATRLRDERLRSIRAQLQGGSPAADESAPQLTTAQADDAAAQRKAA